MPTPLQTSGHYPFLSPSTPPLISAPMLNLSLPNLATAVSQAGGFGFLAGGFDLSGLEEKLAECRTLLRGTKIEGAGREGTLPIGLGLITWGCDLPTLLSAVAKYPPAAIWLFAPKDMAQLSSFVDGIRHTTNLKTKVWVQICSVQEAVEVVDLVRPDVLVVQGGDAGGHGMKGGGAGVISLLPEVKDVLVEKGMGWGDIPLVAAGGISDGRGAAAAMALGAAGVVMGTRFLACKETRITDGYQREILRAGDGGVNTVRTTVYDRVRGIYDWPEGYDGRGVVNRSYVDEVVEGKVGEEENRRLYLQEMEKGDEGWGPEGRMTTYAGTGVGLVKEVLSAREIVEGVHREVKEIVESLSKS